jgi:hypothetical protein
MWRAPFMLGLDGMSRMSKAMSATEGFHKQVEGPHWYLMTVGTRTAKQGQGLGSKLVEMGTSRADAAGLPCYLETGTDSNIAFIASGGSCRSACTRSSQPGPRSRTRASGRSGRTRALVVFWARHSQDQQVAATSSSARR